MASNECHICFEPNLNESDSTWVRYRCGHMGHKRCVDASEDPKRCGICRAVSRNNPQETRLSGLTALPDCVSEIKELELKNIIKI